MDTEVTKYIRDRLTALNTKAYYLLVALAFLYVQSPHTPLLNWALTLTAAVAVLPVQDLVRRVFWLELIRAFKILCLGAALILTLWWAWSLHPTLVAGQNTTPPQTTELQKPKGAAGASDSSLKAIEDKAYRALMEKDYIERIQKEVNVYYEKAFNSLMAIVGIISLLIAIGATFGVNNFVQSKLTDASAKLREEFTKTLGEKFAELEKSHADRLKQLEGSLQQEIKDMGENLDIRGKYSSHSLQGIATFIAHQDDDAVRDFRKALELYLRGKARQLFGTGYGAPILNNLFNALRRLSPTQPENAVKKELADPLYDSLQQELAIAALADQTLAPLINERKAAPSTRPQPAPAHESPTPAPDKGQAAKPQDEKK